MISILFSAMKIKCWRGIKNSENKILWLIDVNRDAIE